KVRIVYATSRIVDDQYHEFLNGVTQILDKYGDRVSLTVWGCQPRELAGRRGVELVPLLPNYDQFLTEFFMQGFDIGLAPLPNTLFHRSKNNTKYRDYGACRVAGVYSNVDVYSSCIEDGQTGILVENTPEAWSAGISRLIENPELTKSIQDRAYKNVYEQYRQELVEEEWMVDINNVFSGVSVGEENGIIREARDVRIRADFPGLYGIRIPGTSPEGETLGKLLFEVITPDGSTLREASSTIRTDLPDGDVEFTFDSIANSSYREFVFRLISIGEEAGVLPGWMPPSGHMQLLYKTRTMAAFGALKS
ncbi:MAG: glycosyltransferase, partial [Leptolyngbya sp.]|nr:glycosyltransferase [Candidatus Melainabacteria bacterium]